MNKAPLRACAKKSIRIFAAIALIAFSDRITKQIALSVFPESVVFTKEYVGLFSINDGAGIVLALAVCLGVSVHAYWTRAASRLFHAAILLGAASNLYDRFAYGAVIDWIRTPLVTLNIADVMIVLGAGGIFAGEVNRKRV